MTVVHVLDNGLTGAKNLLDMTLIWYRVSVYITNNDTK